MIGILFRALVVLVFCIPVTLILALVVPGAAAVPVAFLIGWIAVCLASDWIDRGGW